MWIYYCFLMSTAFYQHRGNLLESGPTLRTRSILVYETAPSGTVLARCQWHCIACIYCCRWNAFDWSRSCSSWGTDSWRGWGSCIYGRRLKKAGCTERFCKIMKFLQGCQSSFFKRFVLFPRSSFLKMLKKCLVPPVVSFLKRTLLSSFKSFFKN
jgi:hypothetical protein